VWVIAGRDCLVGELKVIGLPVAARAVPFTWLAGECLTEANRAHSIEGRSWTYDNQRISLQRGQDMKKLLKWTGVIFLALAICGAGLTDLNASRLSAVVTVRGTVRYEGATDHSGIKVEMWKDGRRADTIGVVTTDDLGGYTFTDVDSSHNYSILAAASAGGYALASLSVISPTLQASGDTYAASTMILTRPKRFGIDWVYQPDGSVNFVSSSLPSGAAVLTSPTTRWTALGTFNSEGSLDSGFCFQDGLKTGCKDVYVGNTSSYPTSLWANSGSGGIHDMGEVPLASLASVPDKSAGVGSHQFYENQATAAVAGHTYAVVTQDGNHYAKFRISGIEYVTPFAVLYLPTIQRLFGGG
jgi:dipeptidyl aminopeptidase/acylaminoacyl peptidase